MTEQVHTAPYIARKAAISMMHAVNIPYGIDCELTGPLEIDCSGNPFDIFDSQEGPTRDMIAPDQTGVNGYIAVYIAGDRTSELTSSSRHTDITGGQSYQLSNKFVLLVEVHFFGSDQIDLEDRCERFHQRLLYRLIFNSVKTITDKYENTWNADILKQFREIRHDIQRGGDGEGDRWIGRTAIMIENVKSCLSPPRCDEEICLNVNVTNLPLCEEAI